MVSLLPAHTVVYGAGGVVRQEFTFPSIPVPTVCSEPPPFTLAISASKRGRSRTPSRGSIASPFNRALT